ncbi:MAG: bifunctional ADP-dependent (S)-NAD(P)H-hydrate dehydratase/NAD(P)H-hydrate epimerase [Geobacteraceae bacterium GWC2_58_44]|nr:MAG: bifunctional ADP-dependent (S)-NAD(P)H-hydrate dehydratase/NAD(P)H-hydrate epimerase [Geobacteraceae bacterium GWC2_58_44]HBG06829.1 bifunctional ADP-dependent NAD(P)H-hydrate dehydratase/NAD(P)H-hydrate epimerase [Geobacter sp.]
MKVVSGQVMQHMDQRAIREFGIAGLTLMEQAGRACADAITEGFGPGAGKRALIVAGKGNNGGDGFVIARILIERGWEAPVLLVAASDSVTGDAAANLSRLDPGTVISAPEGASRHQELFQGATLIVDALLGTGVKSEVTGVYGEAIEMINAAGVPVVAVDIPSGIDAADGRVLGRAVRADLTVSFALPKLGNILQPGAEFCGRLVVADIGMPDAVLSEAPGCEFVDLARARRLYRPRAAAAHKGSSGQCLIIAGSTGKTGAAAMAANSAVRTGAGLVTLAVPAGLNAVLEVKSTEAMTLPVGKPGSGFLPAGALGELLRAARGKDAVALGPGLGGSASTIYLVHSLVSSLAGPLVLDADGLNALAAAPELLLSRRGRVTLLTPHPGEMARLAGCSIPEIEADRIGAARDLAGRFQVYLILKGARSIIAAPDGSIAINGSGNPGMASGGMGDVLTGVLAALVGQGYHPFEACQLAAFVHGYAADLLVERKGTQGLNATDVQEMLPEALCRLSG